MTRDNRNKLKRSIRSGNGGAMDNRPFIAFKGICNSKIGRVLFMCFLLIAGISNSVYAQSLAEKFGGFSGSSNKPININADELRVDDKSKTAVFSGDVRANQEGFSMRSKTLEVFYDGSAASGADGKIRKLAARGKVLITTKEKQTATSEWAIFDVLKQTILLGDNVILSQSGNVIKGGQLEIDLKTSKSRFINKNKGRVQMKFDVPPQKKKTQQKSR